MKSDTQNQLPIKTVLKLSGCLKSMIILLPILVAALSGAIFVMNSNLQSFLRYSLLLSFEFVAIIVLFMFIKYMVLYIKIKTKNYKTKQRLLRSIQSKRFIDHNKDGKVLVFDDVRITVDENKIHKFKIGDMITMVFVNGIQYPVVITSNTQQ